MRRALLIIVALAIPRAAWAQGSPLGPEFRVNTYTTSVQNSPSIASDSSGNFVVVWTSVAEPSYGIFGQRYASSGTPLGAEFRVNTYTTGAQSYPSVAAASSGDFVVVWMSDTQDGSGRGIFGQRYANSGSPLGSEFRVNTYTTNYQDTPSVAADSNGNFVVVWESYAQDGSLDGLFGQRFASSGSPLGPEFRVNTYTTGGQARPAVAAAASGDFVVVWMSQDGSGYGIFGQRYASSGAVLGTEFRVNTYTTTFQILPAVAADTSGNFVVVWTDDFQEGFPNRGIFGQRYASTGAPLGTEFRVNTYTTDNQGFPSIASDSLGNFVVTWNSYNQDGSNYGVFGQRHTSSGVPFGPEFRVNTYTTSRQSVSAVAAEPSGNFVIVWHSNTQDGSSYGIFSQRYAQIVPVELMRFGVE